MIKTRIKLVDRPEIDPRHMAAVAADAIAARRRLEGVNKALLAQVNTVIMPAPVVAPVPPPRPAKVRRVYVIKRDAQGLLTYVTAGKAQFTVKRAGDGSLAQVTTDNMRFVVERGDDGLMTNIIAEPK